MDIHIYIWGGEGGRGGAKDTTQRPNQVRMGREGERKEGGGAGRATAPLSFGSPYNRCHVHYFEPWILASLDALNSGCKDLCQALSPSEDACRYELFH